MRKYQSLLTYLLLFLSISMLLKFFGFIRISSGEIFNYSLILLGISVVYLSLGKNRKISLFFGTVFFLIGILVFVLNNFLIFWGALLLMPTILFISGATFLMLCYDDPSDKKFFVIGSTLILAGLIVTVINGQLNLASFYDSLLKITASYWEIILIAAVILILISFEERK